MTKRTITQNASLHVYAALLANGLNDAGYDVNTTITVPVSFTSETVREYMFKPVQKALYPESVGDWKLSPGQVSEVRKVLCEMVKDKFNIDLSIKPYGNYISGLAEKLNDAGYDVTTTIKTPIKYTGRLTKEYLFRPVMKALYPDYESTTELSTIEIQEVYENLNRLTGEKFGVSMPWPSNEEQS